MPGFDGTGPEGKGPKTGRKLGRCTDKEDQNEIQKGQGLRRGLRRRQQQN
ncbi:DUF5320 domain-containing protein [Candidatus Woesearchaeota archaeon]|nr:DUF5320 domain-containing protein [Candidatus Woesearchaeota archaeon]